MMQIGPQRRLFSRELGPGNLEEIKAAAEAVKNQTKVAAPAGGS